MDPRLGIRMFCFISLIETNIIYHYCLTMKNVRKFVTVPVIAYCVFTIIKFKESYFNFSQGIQYGPFQKGIALYSL